MHFSHRFKKVIKLYVNGTRITIGVCYDHRDITAGTGIIKFTAERTTGISRRTAHKVTATLLTVFHPIAVSVIIFTGIIASDTEAALTFINLRAVEAVITGIGVIRMRAASRTVTGVIRTYIPVIGTHGT
jgi:hypothetical protein